MRKSLKKKPIPKEVVAVMETLEEAFCILDLEDVFVNVFLECHRSGWKPQYAITCYLALAGWLYGYEASLPPSEEPKAHPLSS